MRIVPGKCRLRMAGTESKWGIPERDIWSLGVMVQGSGQMGELLGRRRRRRRRRRRHLEIGVWNSFSFWTWIGLIWEISAWKLDHSAWNFGARLFWKNHKNRKQQYFNNFQDIRKFQETRSKNNPRPPEPDPWSRPPAARISRIWENWKNPISNISRLIENVEDFNFQYFQDTSKLL